MRKTTHTSSLTDEQLVEYRELGFLVLRQLFSPEECFALQRERDRLYAKAKHWDERNLRVQTRMNPTGEAVVDRLDPIVDLSPALRLAASDDRILTPISDILQDGALLLKDKLVFRPPEASGYGVHQDYTLWQHLPAKPEEMLSALLAIDGCSAANGAMRPYPGLHHRHYLEPAEPRDVFNAQAGVVPEGILKDAKTKLIEMTPGDVLIFSSLIPHGTSPNSSDSTRCIAVFTYSAASRGDLRDNVHQAFRRYLRRDRSAAGLQDLHFE